VADRLRLSALVHTPSTNARPAGRRAALLAQSAYYAITAVWPFAHLRSFLRVTGPKRELWLLKTVSALVGVIGSALGVAAWRGRPAAETDVLAVGSAVSLAAIDVVYVARRRISPVYLLDAAVQAALLAAWASGRGLHRRRGLGREVRDGRRADLPWRAISWPFTRTSLRRAAGRATRGPAPRRTA
jgi:hypothetical protein